MFQIPQGNSSNIHKVTRSYTWQIVSNPIGKQFKYHQHHQMEENSQFQIPQGNSSNQVIQYLLLVVFTSFKSHREIVQIDCYSSIQISPYVSNPIGKQFKWNYHWFDIFCSGFQIPQGNSSNVGISNIETVISGFKSHREIVQMKESFPLHQQNIQFQIPQGNSSNMQMRYKSFMWLQFQIPQGNSSNTIYYVIVNIAPRVSNPIGKQFKCFNLLLVNIKSSVSNPIGKQFK